MEPYFRRRGSEHRVASTCARSRSSSARRDRAIPRPRPCPNRRPRHLLVQPRSLARAA
jgi:hypothetical protein